jgi:hypothetical protein
VGVIVLPAYGIYLLLVGLGMNDNLAAGLAIVLVIVLAGSAGRPLTQC